ncbi:MAG: GIY-YIG nuclease family protein [Candidatus Omnitrophica bacterium]|nr:GIY-YIG nuclease family protein [Candidatus Omnitrophota bacterium]
MYYVYVLLSLKNRKHYIGFTSKKPQTRLLEHNSGSNAFTKNNRPFKLIYSEEHVDEGFAKKRERFLKSGYGRSVLKTKLKCCSL